MRVKARKVQDDGITFDSVTEHRRYLELRMLQRAGEISKLQAHPQFVFIVNEITVGKYRPDFYYLRPLGTSGGQEAVCEDVKGWKRSAKTGRLLPRVDRDFSLRRNLMLACFGLKVEIV